MRQTCWTALICTVFFVHCGTNTREHGDFLDQATPAEKDEKSNREELFESHKRLAYKAANKFYRLFPHRNMDREDFEQIALLGLLKASRQYDPARGAQFSTYATTIVYGELKNALRDRARVPAEIYRNMRSVRLATEELWAETGKKPTVAEIAERTKLSGELVLECQRATEWLQPRSLERTFRVGETRFETSLLQTLRDSGAEIVAPLAEKDQLRDALNVLDPVHARMVYDHVVSSMPLEKVAIKNKITRPTAERILRQSLKTMRRYMSKGP